MGLRVWGIALLVLGIVAASVGLFGLFQARGMWNDANARCEGSADAMCGGGQTYVAALLMVTAPFATLGGALMMVAGGILIAVGRWVDGALGDALSLLATSLK